MPAKFDQWLRESTRLDGVLAAGLRYADRSQSTVIYSRQISEALVEAACQGAAEIIQRLKQQKLGSSRCRWFFEKAVVFSVSRIDGTCLCLVTTPLTEEFPGGEIEKILSEFQALLG